MDGLFILAAIAWIVLSAVSRKKQREQQEARKKAAQAGGMRPEAGSERNFAPARPAQPPVQPVERRAPVRQAPPPAPAQPRMPAAAFDVAEGDSAPVQAKARDEQNRRLTAAPGSRVGSGMQSTLRGTPLQHMLEVSSASGHAHEETSITGVQAAACPPEKPARKAAPQAQPVPAAPRAAQGGFVWDQNAVLQGMVMAEILGKPRCLRQSRR